MKISRRDTAIIAVLVNVALLALLFATSTSLNSDSEELHSRAEGASYEKQDRENSTSLAQAGEKKIDVELQKPDELKPFTLYAKPEEKMPVDEIDQVLQEYALKQKLVSFKTADGDERENADKLAATSFEGAPSKKSLEYVEVVVKQGDALAKIAKAYGVKVDDLMKANKLENAKLRIGQSLKVPVYTETKKGDEIPLCLSKENPSVVLKKETKPLIKNSAKAPVKSVSKQKTTPAQDFYVIKSGDNPWKIARKFNLKYEELLSLNNLDEEKARNLKIGQKIRIR